MQIKYSYQIIIIFKQIIGYECMKQYNCVQANNHHLIERLTLNLISIYKVLVLDRNTLNHIFISEFESHWVSYSYAFVPYLSKMLSKLRLKNCAQANNHH